MNSKKNGYLWVVLIILAIALAIVVYYLTFGKYNFFKVREEKKNRLEWLENHLLDLYAKKLTLEKRKIRLDRLVKRSFLTSRLLIGLGYFTLNTLAFLYWTDVATSSDSVEFSSRLSVVLNYNEAFLLIVIFILFMLYEKIIDIREIPAIIHATIRKVVYSGNSEIDRNLEEVNSLMNVAEKEKQQLTSELNQDSFKD